jgi:hypothetical protein
MLLIVYFTGMRMAACSREETEYLAHLRDFFLQHFKKVKTLCLAPPLVLAADVKHLLEPQNSFQSDNGVHLWADYAPLDEAFYATCKVNQVGAWMAHTASEHYALCDKVVARRGHLLFVGVSNGCIPAFEFAKFYAKNTIACIFNNGCPAESSALKSSGGPRPFPIIFAIARGDSYFDSGRRLWALADVLQASVLSFEGRHASLCPIEQLTRAIDEALAKTWLNAGSIPSLMPRRQSTISKHSLRKPSFKKHTSRHLLTPEQM